MPKKKRAFQNPTQAAVKFAKSMRSRLLKANRQLREIVNARLESIAIHLVAPYKGWDMERYNDGDTSQILKGFSFAGMKTKKEMISEARNINRFLSAPASTYEGAEKYTEMLDSEPWRRYMGMFGRKWKNITEHAYSPEISENDAKLAFRAYRIIEEETGNEIIKQVHGSAELIAFLFNEVDLGASIHDAVEAGYKRVNEAYIAHQQRKNKVWKEVNSLPKLIWDDAETLHFRHLNIKPQRKSSGRTNNQRSTSRAYKKGRRK